VGAFMTLNFDLYNVKKY